jgi:hypothetical protein
VRDKPAVTDLAEAAISRFRRIDVRPNNAGNYARPTAPDGPGALLASTGSHEIHGGWREHERRELKAFLASAQGRAGMFRCGH